MKKVQNKVERDKTKMKAGDVFHGMTVLQYCGGGGFGDVYYCRDLSGKYLALKVISKQHPDWGQELKGVVNYQEAARDIPGVLDIYQVVDDADVFYYTMTPADNVAKSGRPEEYSPDTLALRLGRRGPVPVEDLLNYVDAIFQAIKALHQAGVAHRDIKPENVLFVQGHPMLGDVGLMKTLSGSMTTHMVGTLDFLPPESRYESGPSGDSRASRCQNDLYAFGKLLYCMVTGESVQEFPLVPKDFYLSGAAKYYYRLSLRLCEKETNLRLTELEKIELELAAVHRRVEQGETLLDHASYWLHVLHRGWLRHWQMAVSLLACAAIVTEFFLFYFYFSPKRIEKFVQTTGAAAAGKLDPFVPLRQRPITSLNLVPAGPKINVALPADTPDLPDGCLGAFYFGKSYAEAEAVMEFYSVDYNRAALAKKQRMKTADFYGLKYGAGTLASADDETVKEILSKIAPGMVMAEYIARKEYPTLQIWGEHPDWNIECSICVFVFADATLAAYAKMRCECEGDDLDGVEKRVNESLRVQAGASEFWNSLRVAPWRNRQFFFEE